MRVLVCGGREYDNWEKINQGLTNLYLENKDLTEDGLVDFTIIEGGAKGADFLARVWAVFRHLPYIEIKADWQRHGKAAGGIRNNQMLVEGKPDVVLAFPGGAGTADMVRRAKVATIRVIEI